MDEKEQIKEIADIVSKCITSWLNNETTKSSPDYIAEALYNADYRKASDIFEEISKASVNWSCYNMTASKTVFLTEEVNRTLARLKKKYTEYTKEKRGRGGRKITIEIPDKEKQIEEMADIIFKSSPSLVPPVWRSDAVQFAEALYAKGYCKASDVAREICDAADEIINLICAMTGIEITAVGGKYLKLRKKYTEEPK